MSKYIVLYRHTHVTQRAATKSELSWGSESLINIHVPGIAIKEFDDETIAALFAIENRGWVLVPASINMTVTEPKS